MRHFLHVNFDMSARLLGSSANSSLENQPNANVLVDELRNRIEDNREGGQWDFTLEDGPRTKLCWISNPVLTSHAFVDYIQRVDGKVQRVATQVVQSNALGLERTAGIAALAGILMGRGPQVREHPVFAILDFLAAVREDCSVVIYRDQHSHSESIHLASKCLAAAWYDA